MSERERVKWRGKGRRGSERGGEGGRKKVRWGEIVWMRINT